MLSYLQARGVQHLVHFTRASNLPSILRYGLLSRELLEGQQLQHAVNDLHRFDYLPNAICLSVSFPNYRLFYRFRQAHPNEDWVVLRLKPDLVASKRCAFSHANAASRALAMSPIESRMTMEALDGLFCDHEDYPPRAALNIPNHYTTNPQAEILVLDPIEPSYVTAVLYDSEAKVRNMAALRALEAEHRSTHRFIRLPGMFSYRRDFEHWRGAQDG